MSPVESFSADWLQQREPFDTAARTAAAGVLKLQTGLDTLRPASGTPWRVIDLACGTGANLRWLAPRLGGPQEWLVVDHDTTLLRCWPERLGVVADPDAMRAPLVFSGPGFQATIVRQPLDLAHGLETLPWHAAHLVTASALLDLVSAAWLQRLVAAAVAARVALLFTLSVDGRHDWGPRDPLDSKVSALFGEHQRRDKGFGPALGADALPALQRALRGRGYRVFSAPSDWQIDGQDGPQAAALQRALVDGMASAASEQDPLSTDVIEAWRQRRHAWTASGSVRVGHLDLLALPPARS
jgi:SAM-dependent methyltransferase